jgi:hypothetical protein
MFNTNGCLRPDQVVQTSGIERHIGPEPADPEWESRRSAKRPNLGHSARQLAIPKVAARAETIEQ